MTWSKSLVTKVILILVGLLIAWGVFFSIVIVTKVEDSFLASTGEMIRNNKQFLIDITSKSNKAAKEFVIAYTHNTAETQERDLKDMAFDLYRGDEARIKEAISKKALAWKERSKRNIEIISAIRVERVIKEIKTQVENLREYQILQTQELARQMRMGISVFFFIAILSFALGIGFWLLSAVVRPIRIMSEGTKRIATGDFTRLLEIKSKDELGVLAASFNQMIEDLQQTMVSKEYVENIINSMIDTLVVVTPAGTIQSVNQAACDLLKYQPEELIEQPVKKILEEEEEEEVQSLFRGTGLQKLIKRGIIKGIERTYLTKDKGKVPVLFSGSVMRNRDNKIIGIVCVAHDITEQKKHEEELRKLLLAIEQSPVSVFVTDRVGNIEYVNQKFVEVTGYSKKEAIGQNPRILKSGKHLPEFYKEMWETILSGKEWQGELCNRKKNGKLYWEYASLSPVYDAMDKITHFVAVKEDITQKRIAAQELQRAKEDAEAATQAKSNFLANMSHEIRTPLNAVLGFLELVLEDLSLPELQRKHLTTAQISASGLLGLINDILDISKLESGKLTIEQRPFSLRRLMQEIRETMDVKAREKGLKLQLDIKPSVSGSFVGDPLRIRQIIINLVGNAIKFTEKGNVFTRIMPAEEEGQLHFMIEDTGIGIPPDRVNRIFEPFTQADASTTRRFGGTGLGTTISQELVELMGGRIWAESEVGKGSTFHFTINIAPTDQVSEEADLFIVPGKAVLPGPRRGFRILLVEDIEANVDLAKVRLKQQDHEVTVTWNGRQAVEAFQRGEFDVILMDIQMPEMDGMEATMRIRALEASTGGHVPIIAMTAGVMREETEKYLEVGMDAIVAKPINFGKLFKTMEGVVPEGVGEAVTEEAKDISAPTGLELPPLDGVDIKKGIQTWQNPEAYAKALLGFSRDYGNAAADLTRLIDKGDIDSAYHFSHTLKGVAGNLSVTKVADAAVNINAALREKRLDDVKDMLPLLAAALNRAVDSIRQLEAVQDDEKKPQKEMDIAHLKELFFKMLAAFDQFSPYAIEPFLSELKEYLSQDQLNPIVDHMERFDFNGAKQETVKLANTLQIVLEG